jgi:hypothetical protein
MAHSCNAWGHGFGSDEGFFSPDFARYFSPTRNFSLTWCFHCARVLIYRRPFAVRVFRGQMLRFESAHSLCAARDTKYFRECDGEAGFFAGAHLMRMVWHCLQERTSAIGFRGSHEVATMHLALKKMPAKEVALMAAMTLHAPFVVPIERQIWEGKYLAEHWQLSQIRSWITSSPDTYPRAMALSYLDSFNLKEL